MFFLARRRPLLGAAMIEGAGYLAGRAGQEGRHRSGALSQEEFDAAKTKLLSN